MTKSELMAKDEEMRKQSEIVDLRIKMMFKQIKET